MKSGGARGAAPGKEGGERRGRRGKEIEVFGADALLLVFSRLSPRSLAACSVVCTLWHDVIQASPLLWNKAYMQQASSLKARFGQLSVETIAASEWRTRAIQDQQRALLVHGSMSVRSWKAHSARVNTCRMIMDTIVSGSADQTIRVWSVNSLHCTEEYKLLGKGPVVDLEFDENKIMAAAGSEVWVWSRNGKRRVIRRMGGHDQRLHCMCYMDPEVAVGCGDGTTRVYDMYSGLCSRIFRQHSGAVTSVAFDVVTQLMASGSHDGTVQLYDGSSGKHVACLLPSSCPIGVNCMQMGLNGHNVFAGTTIGGLYCWDLRYPRLVWEKRVSNNAVMSLHSQAYAPATLIVGGLDGVVRVVDATSGTLLSGCTPISALSPTSHGSSQNAVRNTYVHVTNEECARHQAGKGSVPGPYSSILCLRLGLTRLLMSHADATITLCEFSL